MNTLQTQVVELPFLISAEQALIAANEYILFKYATGLVGTVPRRLSTQSSSLWIVPVVLTSPGYGIVGEVGVVAVDAQGGQVVGGTPSSEVLAAQERLVSGKQDELEAAFLRARKA